MKIWTCGSSPESGSRNAWTRIKKHHRCQSSEQLLEYSRGDPNNFLSRNLVISLWPGNKKQSMEWQHSCSPRPKISVCKNPLEKSSPRFFGIKTASSSLIIFQRAKLSKRSIARLCWCNWRTFWRKNASGKFAKVFLFLHDNAPTHRALATQKKLAYLGFQYLDQLLCPLDLTPSDYHLFPGLKKRNNWKVAIFRPTRRSLLPPETWLDGQTSEFFWGGRGLSNVRATMWILSSLSRASAAFGTVENLRVLFTGEHSTSLPTFMFG